MVNSELYARSLAGKKLHLIYSLERRTLWCGASLEGAPWSSAPPPEDVCQNCERRRQRMSKLSTSPSGRTEA